MTDFDFNPFDPETRRDPGPIYARARREHPVYRHPGLPIVSVFRYADAQAILRDPETWSSQFPPPPGVDPERLPPPSMLGQDPPNHTRLRSLVSQAFTPRMIRRLEPRLHAIADELMTTALAQGEVDFVQAMTYPLPVIVIAEIIGVPAEERPQFKAWSDIAVAGLGTGLFAPPDMARLEQVQAVLREMGAYFTSLADARRLAPREDLLSGLVRAEVEGSRLSHAEMITMLVLLLVAGNETTTTLIGNAVLELLDHPDALARLRAEPELLPTAIEEVLRFSSPVQLDPRRATRRVELGGEVIEPDQIVVSWLGSANRDEEIFPDAERFDITRADNRHMAFGFGPHYCLGANLARLEAQAAIGALLRHTRAFARATSDPLPLHPSLVFKGVTSLPLRLEGRAPAPPASRAAT
ncbi:cytochrome P450 [bacterium]|nr:cytochrome P450 [bacterium]